MVEPYRCPHGPPGPCPTFTRQDDLGFHLRDVHGVLVVAERNDYIRRAARARAS